MNPTLEQFLASPQRPEGTMTYHMVQGFLFAVCCSPETIQPSEWLPMIFDDQDAGYSSMKEAQKVIDELMELYNAISRQVYEDAVTMPEDMPVREPVLDNLEPDAALGKWSRGFFHGHHWLMELWEQYTPEELEDELGSSLMVLSFFSHRALAEAFHQEMGEPAREPLESFSGRILDLFEDAMREYASLGRDMQMLQADPDLSADLQETFLRDSPTVGRNDPCPCGSGRRFKHCCLH